jgi:hypothetical protein
MLMAGEDRPLAEEALGGIEAPPLAEDTTMAGAEDEDVSKLTLEEYQQMHGKQASKKTEKLEAPADDSANLLGFKGDDEGPIDEKKSQAARGKTGQIGQVR